MGDDPLDPGRLTTDRWGTTGELEVVLVQEKTGGHSMPVATAGQSRSIPTSRTRQVGAIAWIPNQELDAKQWAAAGRRIGAVGRCIQWVLGDWIAYGNERFGERYSRVSKITGYDAQTLMNMVYVASRFQISRRRESLSWSHHETVAALDREGQDRWLDQTEINHWSVSDLRMMMRMSRKADERSHNTGTSPITAEMDGSEAPEARTGRSGRNASLAKMVVCPQCGYKMEEDIVGGMLPFRDKRSG